MRAKIIMFMGFTVLLGVASASAQPAHLSSIKVKIDFPFVVSGQTLPPGVYEFARDDRAAAFNVVGEGKHRTVAPILTRITGETHTTPEDAHLVFDIVGDASMLSEIWIPGDDGYVMLATKAIHRHKVINIKL